LLAEYDPGKSDARALELHSFRKLFATGPAGISFLVGPKTLIRKIRDYSEYAWSPLSSLQVRLASRCAQDVNHVQMMRSFFRDRIARLRSTLQEVGFDPYPTPSGIYVLCRVPSAIQGELVAGAEHAAAILFDKFGVAVVPWNTPRAGFLRFTALYNPEDLEALAGLGADLDMSAS
jgi:aspartate/methionine/tyrosine aminotransferase